MIVTKIKLIAAGLLIAAGAFGFEPYGQNLPFLTPYRYSGDTYRLEWCQPFAKLEYVFEIEIEHVEMKTVVARATNISKNYFDFIIPRTGHYIFRIRTRNTNTDMVSEWTNSYEATESLGGCEGQRPFWLYAHIAPSGDILEL